MVVGGILDGCGWLWVVEGGCGWLQVVACFSVTSPQKIIFRSYLSLEENFKKTKFECSFFV